MDSCLSSPCMFPISFCLFTLTAHEIHLWVGNKKAVYFNWITLSSGENQISTLFKNSPGISGAPQVVLVIKNLPANARDLRDAGSILGSGRCPVGGNGNPLQYSCLENPMDRGVCQAIVHRISKSWTRLEQLSMHTCIYRVLSLELPLGKNWKLWMNTSAVYVGERMTVA